MLCLLNPLTCAQSIAENAFYSVITGVPWWAWVALILVVLGVAWRFAGIPGLVAAAGAIGFIFGRFRIPVLPQKAPPPRPWGDARVTPPDVDEPHETAWDKMIRGEKLD